MATILPKNPAGAFPADTLRVFRLLRGLPDTYTVWQRLGAGGGPDFWVRRDDGRCALIAVARASRADVRAARQNTLFGQAEAPGAAEQDSLLAFLSGI